MSCFGGGTANATTGGSENTSGKESTLLAQNTSALPPFPWQWIHPPKTATSFGHPLFMLGCPEDFRKNWTPEELEMHSIHPKLGLRGASPGCRSRWINGDTAEYRPAWWLGEHASRSPTLSDNQLFITVREPIDRSISHYYYLKPRGKASESEIVDFIIQNRLTELMTGFFFPPHTQGLRNRTDEACQVIQNAAWVGLTRKYTQSVCLLHARFDFPRHPAESVNMRPGSWPSINKTQVEVLVRQRTEVLDDVVYQCALERFESDLELYAPQCK